MDFAPVETKFRESKEKYDAGAITEEEFKAQLEELMIQDEEGRWWMIGYETGQWYYHDGEEWVPSKLPGRATAKAAPQSVAGLVASARPWVRRFLGIVVLLLGLALTLLAGLIVLGGLGADLFDEAIPSAGAIVIWVGGAILTIFIARKVWRPR